MSYRLGIDVGGTFTDFLVLGDAVQLVHKTSSTPHDPSEGFVRGLEEIAGRLGVPFPELMASIDLIVHGTTVSTNAALTGNGARTGALMTEGFRDTLRAARRHARDAVRQPPDAAAPARAARADLRRRRSASARRAQVLGAARRVVRARRRRPRCARTAWRPSRSPSCTRRRTRRTSGARWRSSARSSPTRT